MTLIGGSVAALADPAARRFMRLTMLLLTQSSIVLGSARATLDPPRRVLREPCLWGGAWR